MSGMLWFMSCTGVRQIVEQGQLVPIKSNDLAVGVAFSRVPRGIWVRAATLYVIASSSHRRCVQVGLTYHILNRRDWNNCYVPHWLAFHDGYKYEQARAEYQCCPNPTPFLDAGINMFVADNTSSHPPEHLVAWMKVPKVEDC